MASDDTYRLLGPHDPPPFELINGDAEANVIFVCDHASNAIPHVLGTLGLAQEELELHIAIDIGAGEVTRRLAHRFGATAVLAGYSRLVVDTNRNLEDATAFIEENDDIRIPGNIGIHAQEREARVEECFKPYHDAIAAQLTRLNQAGVTPAFLAIHSFTPILSSEPRPWEIGILWDKDERIARPLIEMLEERYELHVGDNQPYSGQHPADFTVDHHAEGAGLAHCGIEIRHDLISDELGIDRMAALLGDTIEIVLGDESLYHVSDYGNPAARQPLSP